MINRRKTLTFVSTAALLCGTGTLATAADCSADRVSDLKKRCLETLNDIASTISAGAKLEADAWAKGKEAAKPSYDCAKGAFDLGAALFTDCNPSSPGFNPLECVLTLADVPETIETCQQAISLIRETISLYKQSKEFYGAAAVAFHDQGGHDIAVELAGCGEPSCEEQGQSLSDKAKRNADRAERNIKTLEDHERNLLSAKEALESCQSNSDSCGEIPNYEFPTLEPGDTGPPTIILD